MNKIKTLLIIAAVCIFTSACSIEDYGTVESELETTYRIGTNATVVATTTSAIATMYQDVPQLPNAPFASTAGSGFKEIWSVDNGGHQTGGVGNLNMVTFRVNLVLATPTVPAYYLATADIWKADSSGHTTLTTNAITVTAPPRWEFVFDWEAGDLGIGVFDTLGNWVAEADYPLVFTAGPAITRIHSPELDFTVDSGTGGCHNDILGYDTQNNGHNVGHFYVEAWAGPTVTTQVQALVAAPTSNSKCSLMNTLPGDDDVVQWEVTGF